MFAKPRQKREIKANECKESLETQRNRRDYGRELGRRITYTIKSIVRRAAHYVRRGGDSEYEPLLNPKTSRAAGDEETLITKKGPAPPPPGFREVLNYQSVLNLILYAVLALHNLAYDQLLPIFMHHPSQDHSPANPDYQPPFKFSGGFGLNSGQIGFLFTLYGFIGMVIQFLIFPPIARKYGIVGCLRVISVILPFIYAITPFTALLPDRRSQQIAIFIAMNLKNFCTTFAFPCSTILLTNCASSLRVLGTLNGIATSVGAIGRAAGPAISGGVFTLGVKHGWVVAPFWLLAAIAVVAAIPVFFVVEGEGFGGDDEVEDSDDEGIEAEQDEEADEIGEMLSRTTTASSHAIAEEDEEDDARVLQGPSRRASRVEGQPRRLSRKVSIPIGMGSGISRRFSSNLGQSMGSAGSFGG